MHIKYLYIKLLLLILVSSGSSFFSSAQERGLPIIRNYTPKEYKGAPQVFGAIQDDRGVMYFGCGSVIAEYDGVTWRRIEHDKQKTFFDFAKDSKGRIYVSAMDDFGYLSYNNQGTTVYKSIANLLGDSVKIGFVWTVRVNQDDVFFITYDAIFRYSPLSKTLTTIKALPNDGFLEGFVFNNTFYTLCEKGGLFYIENDKLKPANQSKFFANKNIFRTALPFDSSTLFVPTRTDGLFLYKPNGDIRPKPFYINDPSFLTENNIYNASGYMNSYFVLGSVDKGALLINKQGEVLQRYEVGNLQNKTIRTIYQDKNQNLWFGLENGISRSESALDLTYWDKNSGLKGRVFGVIRHNGKMYIATSVRLYFINKQNKLQEIKNMPVGHNWCFFEHQQSGSLLVGSRYGIYKILDDSVERIVEVTHAAKMFQSLKNPERVFCSTLPDFISFRYENGKWINEGKWAGIKDQILGIIEDDNGEIWLGTYRNGVIRVTPNCSNITQPLKIRYYTERDGFATLSDILPFRLGKRIVFGSEKGLYIYNSKADRFEPFCELGEQFCNGSRSVFSLIEMTDGKIWISPKDNGKHDIGYLTPHPNGGYKWTYVPFRRIPATFIESFYVEASGVVWVGGNEGLYRFDINRDTKNYSEGFECLLRRVNIGNDSLLFDGNGEFLKDSLQKKRVEILYSLNKVRFEFAAPFFDQDEKTLYSCKLDGFDKSWSNFSRDAYKEYSNLPEGSYTFLVKARNIYDVETPVCSFRITILPPFYRTWWAFGIYALLLVSLTYTILKAYTQILRKQKEYLKQVVKERTAKLVEQKEELQAINEELQSTLLSLKQTQQHLIHSEKMASLGVLASGVAHEINNPLNFINGGLTGLKQYFLENPCHDKKNVDFFIESISEGLDRAVRIVAGLNHFCRHGEVFNNRLNLHVIIDNCLLIIKNIIKDRIEIIRNYTNEPYDLLGNEGDLHQAVLNILLNSVQAIDDKGQIIITSSVIEGNIAVSFTDTGCGISEEVLPKVFDPFFTTKEPGKGTGLGLSIVYNIIKEHKGGIEVKSQQGQGTTVIIKLPVNNQN